VENNIFCPADILLPRDIDFQSWAVVACDQYTSEREYWTRADLQIGSAPSTLRMIIPEAYLSAPNLSSRERAVGIAAEAYLKSGILHEYPGCFVYVERVLRDGRVRRGLVGALDLDAYGYAGGDSPIRATEQTVPGRLPPRVRSRRGSPLELTHIMALIDDAGKSVIEPLSRFTLPVLYNFPLMENSGRLRGFLVGSVLARELSAAISALAGGILIGDGNHSLAAAKQLWDEIKPGLSARERETCPARFALAELCNVYDDAIDFHPIHRVVFGVNAEDFIGGLEEALSGDGAYTIRCVSAAPAEGKRRARRASEREFRARSGSVSGLIAETQGYIDAYTESHRGKPGAVRADYIHGEKPLRYIASGTNRVGVILPAMEKSELFRAAASAGVLPRKSFSIGEPWDKRFYMECRRMR
jgi:hypothetical protein